MRQAGRYMTEYRQLRERYSLLDICRTPDLATAVTLRPVRSLYVPESRTVTAASVGLTMASPRANVRWYTPPACTYPPAGAEL